VAVAPWETGLEEGVFDGERAGPGTVPARGLTADLGAGAAGAAARKSAKPRSRRISDWILSSTSVS
jgi:hypothetical protein